MSDVEDLFARYGSMVLRRAERLLGNREMARDVLQEVFVSVINSKDRFRGAASPSTWLYAITTNYCLQHLRDDAGRRAKLAHPSAEGAGMGTGALAATDTWSTLRQALGVLPEELSRVAIHYYVDRMSHDEIAEIEGLSRRTIGNRLEAFHQAAASAGFRNEE